MGIWTGKDWLVDREDTRVDGNGVEDKCFYCTAAPGKPHDKSCVIRQRRVKMRTTIEYVVEVTECWDSEDIESYRNESTVCANEVLVDIATFAKHAGCLCDHQKTEYVGEVGPGPLTSLVADGIIGRPCPAEAEEWAELCASGEHCKCWFNGEPCCDCGATHGKAN